MLPPLLDCALFGRSYCGAASPRWRRGAFFAHAVISRQRVTGRRLPPCCALHACRCYLRLRLAGHLPFSLSFASALSSAALPPGSPGLEPHERSMPHSGLNHALSAQRLDSQQSAAHACSGMQKNENSAHADLAGARKTAKHQGDALNFTKVILEMLNSLK